MHIYVLRAEFKVCSWISPESLQVWICSQPVIVFIITLNGAAMYCF